MDEAQTLRFNGRVYNRAAFSVEDAADNARIQTPYNSFNLLQDRTFLNVELRHNLTDLVTGKYQGALSFLQHPLRPLQWLRPEDLSYFVTYRGEYDGVWDYGPDTFSEEFPLLSDCGPIDKSKREHPRRVPGCTRLETRNRLRHRHRLFEAYVDFTRGPLFLRIGRQNLSWGETDAFRLLDQINPLDASFGGFLVSLDERRVPLDMARVVYSLESAGPFSELNLEGYGVLDDKVATPVPTGSPWSTPNPPGIKGFVKMPAKNFTDARGGFRITARLGELTLSAAHYYTFLDTPLVQLVTPKVKPPVNLAEFDAEDKGGNTARFLVNHFQANLRYPKIAISGATASFGLPRFYAVVRSEVAIFWREPFSKNSGPLNLLGPVRTGGQITPGYKQVGIDPINGSPLLRYKNDIDRSHVVRWSLGIDINRYIRFLNPQQSFIISGQMFATHIVNFDDTPLASVLPYGFGHFAVGVRDPHRQNAASVNLDQHQFVNTLAISTSYRSGVIAPRLVFFYDWQGSWLVQPQVTFIRDPFRLTLQYNYLDGQYNGIGFLRDRDNFIVQLEYVL
ncbi:MAG: hypothetical protein HYZ72_11150 [Deltaproteobacteria bacterium]|nr:hypothetical protein [Deltaproteobacteria bacterium]